MDNRLAKPQTQDVVFKIKIKDAVCELQLAMEQDETKYHLNHCLYEILRSPLGIVFGSYIFQSKGVHYPFVHNCKDIISNLRPEDRVRREEAEYVVKTMTEEADEG